MAGCATVAPKKVAPNTTVPHYSIAYSGRIDDQCKDIQLQLYDAVHEEPCTKIPSITHLLAAMHAGCEETDLTRKLDSQADTAATDCQGEKDDKIGIRRMAQRGRIQECTRVIEIYRDKLLAATVTCDNGMLHALPTAAAKACGDAFTHENGDESNIATALGRFDVDVRNAQRRCLAKK
ncbi:hypothetical protein HZA42_05705 [Candidatus Peregrinibacteria bacterium]|nr:hypothetical protein [Candidatus Peregrinibacteria bacterium]